MMRTRQQGFVVVRNIASFKHCIFAQDWDRTGLLQDSFRTASGQESKDLGGE